MSLLLKDYITFIFSAAALALSLYNLYRARKEATATTLRSIEQKRFECVAVASEAKGAHIRNQTALEAVRFDALRVSDSSLVQSLDREIQSQRESIRRIAAIEQELRRKTTADGTNEELLELEKVLGGVRTMKADGSESELRIAGLIATARQKLLAASLLSPPPVSPVPPAKA